MKTAGSLAAFGLFGVAALTGLSPRVAAAQTTYLAFGDSITEGVGDEANKGGYPRRLKKLLNKEIDAEVINAGMAGEDSFGALDRVRGTIAANPADVLLLMTGTNDVELMVDGFISPEATAFNIGETALRGKREGLEVIHATVVPRPKHAFRDSGNFFTRRLIWDTREIAYDKRRRLVDPYQAFDPAQMQNPTALYYAPPNDPVTGLKDFVGHPNAAGYDRMAQFFADVLLERDTVPPVVGIFEPGVVGAVAREVAENAKIRVPLYEFSGSSGFDRENTWLIVNNTPTGKVERRDRKAGIDVVHRGPEAFGCRLLLQVLAQDRADPPNILDLFLEFYDIEGRTVLRGDVDSDCRVDGQDLIEFARSFGKSRGEKGFFEAFDYVNDDVIDGRDFAVLAKNFGKDTLPKE